MKKLISGLLAALLLISAPGLLQSAGAISADEGAVSAANSSSYEVKVTSNALTIRAKADKTSAVKGYLQKNDVVTIVDEAVDSRGYTWGKLSTGEGWISLRYTDWAGASSDDSDSGFLAYDVKVTASSLNIRNKPSSNGTSIVGVLAKGKVVTIVGEDYDAKGKLWGELDDGRGWIYLGYTKVYNGSDVSSYDVKVTATTLNIRASANGSSEIVGFLRKGNIMTIVAEKKDSNGTTWGQLDNGDGWICLRYTTKVSSAPVFAQYKVKVTASSLRVRAGAGVNTSITGGLAKGTVVTIVAEKKDSNGNTWGKLSNGLGWIYLNYTKKV